MISDDVQPRTTPTALPATATNAASTITDQTLTMLAVRPYFRIQASRFLSALVSFPLPIFVLMVAQELFVSQSSSPLPPSTPASQVYFAVVAILFFAVAVHCVRHRHLFIETTNLRELLDSRIEPRRAIGGVAFDA